jgi:hypothetical protein
MADLNAIQNCRQAAVNIAASGDNLVLSNAVGPVIVYGLTVVAGGAVNITLKNGTSHALTGAIPLVNGGSIDFTPTFERYTVGTGTGANGGFYINLSGAVQLSGTIYYKLGK